MNATLIFSAKPLKDNLSLQQNYAWVRIAVDIFFSYMLELHHHRVMHDEVRLSIAVQQYVLKSPDVLDELSGTNTALHGILEILELLIHEYYNEVLGVLNELSSEYGVVQIQFAKLTPYTLTAIARLVHILPAPEYTTLPESPNAR